MDKQYHIPPIPALASEKPVVPVVSAIDAAYVPVYGAFLASLLAHAGSDSLYDLILLTENVPSEALHAFRAQTRPFPQVRLRHVDMTHYPVPYLDRIGYKKPVFFRLVMPDLLPGYDRAIYLDTDTILLQDVAALFHSPLRGFAAAVVDATMHAYNNSPHITEKYLGEYGNISTYWQKHLGLGPRAQETYFNSGVMVLNLEEMRQAVLSTAIMDLLHAKPFAFVDQDILNIAFDGNISLLPPQWNFFPYLNPRLRYPDAVIAERENAIKNINLLHYAGKQPWKTAGTLPYEEFFWFYARKSVYYEALCVQKQAAQHAHRLPSRIKRSITTSPPLMLFKQHCPGVYGKLRSCWRRLHG